MLESGNGGGSTAGECEATSMIKQLRLLEQAPPGAPARELFVSKEEFLIGRGSDCDLRLPDEAVSRHHCLLRIVGDEADVSDLGSSNGTFLNGQRIVSQVVVRTGDTLRVGPHTFIIDLGDGAPLDLAATLSDTMKKTVRLQPPDR